ncbi:hypothetical protein K435DRAFT_798836 [Dendrothele bispora CBS 962.96]|uniref:Uncharacterized protein n=1 Tax=Dendrothele bispora (strain CBS 962.96) TaxID=1314807 RepID=A0A4S8LZ23_DENBC|nr:hypothetical protein K435DRAFT_798836 [Dendrothele bispora CBS 962.96]
MPWIALWDKGGPAINVLGVVAPEQEDFFSQFLLSFFPPSSLTLPQNAQQTLFHHTCLGCAAPPRSDALKKAVLYLHHCHVHEAGAGLGFGVLLVLASRLASEGASERSRRIVADILYINARTWVDDRKVTFFLDTLKTPTGSINGMVEKRSEPPYPQNVEIFFGSTRNAHSKLIIISSRKRSKRA